ncbi:hypothetical protein ACFYYH_14900 [Streptomyces sp. NPDC002018]|uniref:hypothetical protein n=1 Tax=Streptomyces sp. NPDC002018 TaxID=3364629 RepID=UPI00368A18E0
MTHERTWDVVRRYHEAWTTTKDFDAASRLLAERLETDLPVNTYVDKEEFVKAIRGFGESVSSVQLLSACAGPAPGEALMIYDLVLDPIGTLRIAEQFKVARGRITFIRQVHDTATMRAAGFAPALSL